MLFYAIHLLGCCRFLHHLVPLRVEVLTCFLAAAVRLLFVQFVQPSADDDDSDDDASAEDNSSKYLHELPELHQASAASLDINTTRQVNRTLQQRMQLAQPRFQCVAQCMHIKTQ
jgi:hypothetical protein